MRIRDRRQVHNHIGTVHAMALCHLAELGAGVMTDATLPSTMRRIPKGLTVEYLEKATGPLHGVATPETALSGTGASGEWPVLVQITDAAGDTVFRAGARMWVSARRSG